MAKEKKPSKSWAYGKGASGYPQKKRSAKFRYILSIVALIGSIINFIVAEAMHTVQLADYILLAAGICVFAFVATLYTLEKQGKIFQ